MRPRRRTWLDLQDWRCNLALASETLISLPELTESDWDLILILDFDPFNIETGSPMTRDQWTAVIDMAVGLAVRGEAYIAASPDLGTAADEPLPQAFRELAVKIIRAVGYPNPELQEQVCNMLLNPTRQ